MGVLIKERIKAYDNFIKYAAKLVQEVSRQTPGCSSSQKGDGRMP
jgi:hypothetical protein